jgi:hypothetical protein
MWRRTREAREKLQAVKETHRSVPERWQEVLGLLLGLR